MHWGDWHAQQRPNKNQQNLKRLVRDRLLVLREDFLFQIIKCLYKWYWSEDLTMRARELHHFTKEPVSLIGYSFLELNWHTSTLWNTFNILSALTTSWNVYIISLTIIMYYTIQTLNQWLALSCPIVIQT